MHEGALNRLRPVPHSRFRLFVLHHAGGSHLGYRGWVRHFPEDWEICLLDAPGRARSAHEPPLRNAEALAERMHEVVRPELDRPFGLFGHSMGALVAYELALRLTDAGTPPLWLGASAWSPAPGPERAAPRHLVSADRLRETIARMGGTPRRALDDPDLWSFVEPLVRADLELVDTWSPTPRERPLRVPLSVFGGAQDRGMTPERLAGWSEHVEGGFAHHTLPGDHFYFSGRTAEVVNRITQDVEPLLD
ncbi:MULTISPECIES: thioesterase II family protein [unclassified Nocardiopsis]|uniref:thioesterase II family protein n=1 Tax=unclassified Nocardiopsis TaxID=2649073 RepID=UPI00066E460E|nr:MULTISPECIES: alpha/beta fold hydrolase [unclassified Nocardiopsis]MBQ1079648.1 thioesterase [Nocardiopsis sp. B62]